MKSQYYCKCGRTFLKDTQSSTTGCVLKDFGPNHGCYGCPYICQITNWCSNHENKIPLRFECRGSKLIRYDTYAELSLGDKCVGRIYSLDFDFLHQIRDFADALPGIEKDRYAFTNRPSDYGDDGRYRFTIYPTQNKAGIEAKAVLFTRFFSPDGSRKDISKDAEKEMILNSIEKSKTEKTYVQESKSMGKLNLASINASLNNVKSITESLANISHFELIPLENIIPASNNPFADGDTDQSRYEVAMTIQTSGLIEPLVVNKKSQDKYTLISGEHRFTAIKQYLAEQFKKLPCMVFEGLSDDEAELKLYVANKQREYTPEQKFKRYQELEILLHRMKESGDYLGPIQKGIADMLGVSTRQVRKYQLITEKLSPEQQQAVISGEVSINDACRTIPAEEKSGTGSAFPETTGNIANGDSEESTKPELQKYDSPYWNERILAALKYHYDKDDIYAFYIFQVPTTSEAIKEKLKPAYGYSGGSVKFSDDTWGDLTARSQKMTVTCGRKSIELTYSQVDEIMRKAIREEKWLSPKEAKALIIRKYKISN